MINDKLKTVFMGTPEFAVPILEALAEKTNVILVVTQPDRPSGRGRKLEAPPVKAAAERLGVSVEQPDVVKGKRFTGRIAALEPDLIVTAAFGKILGRGLLELPRFGCLNVHASLLPALRGAAPINWAIIEGATITGVSIMKMDEGLDSGPVYLKVSSEIGDEETAGELTHRLARLGAEAFCEVLERWHELKPIPQNHDMATWAPILSKRDGRIDWSKSAFEIHRHIRGMHPWPCATTDLDGLIIKIHSAKVVDNGRPGQPGIIVNHSVDGVEVACKKGTLLITGVQMPGKKRLDAREFFSGCRLEAGKRFS